MPSWHPVADSVSVESWLGLDSSLATVSRRDPDFYIFSQHQLYVIRITTLTVASISIAATLLATFWFLRMRRSFRHDLIILLIQSDLLKASWFVVYASVQLARGTVASSSPICQVSGFFLAFGFEIGDMAVFLIALHTALFIIRRGSGLYPYRHVAYAAVVLFPLLLASLAFVTTPAYTNSGYYCYISSNPDWKRRVLSWIPRYVIMAFICVAYASTYFYVNVRMKRFDKVELAGRQELSTARNSGHQSRPAVPFTPTPPAAYHGLIPPTLPCESSPVNRLDQRLYSHAGPTRPCTMEERQHLAAVPEESVQLHAPAVGLDSSQPTIPSQPHRGFFAHLSPGYGEPCQSTQEEQAGSRSESTPGDMPSVPLPSKRDATRKFWNHTGASTARSSRPNTQTAQDNSPWSSASSTSVSLRPAAALGDATGMGKARNKIRRQMRQLFIYPAVYLFVWFMPFVAHVTPASKSTFGLILASLVSLCFQGIVDSVVFCILEKPWRHPRRFHGLFWTCGFMSSWSGGRSSVGSTAIGRTREEMLVDSRLARRRRDEEFAERRLPHLTPHASPREWWDVPLTASEPTASEDGGIR